MAVISKLDLLFAFLAAGIATSCTVSDASTPAPAAASVASQAAAPNSGSVQINGIANFRQTALVLTDSCRSAKYETDRQAFARAAIDNALGSYALALPGGLHVDVQSLSLRMRCHAAGPGALQSYCAAQGISHISELRGSFKSGA